MNTTTHALRIDIWSDIACPWCYVGKRHLEAALARFAHRDRVEVIWRAFELDPAAPRVRTDGLSYAARLAAKYHTTGAQADAMIRTMTEVAAAVGLDFRFDRIQPGNTFDAHRLLHLARERGVQDALEERLLRAYLTDGEAIGDPAALARLAVDAGLDAGEATRLLDGDAGAAEVRADEEEAAALGISGVPFFVLDGRYALSGAQPADVILAALDRAWADVSTKPPAGGGAAEESDGAVCGPDGCA